MNTNNDAVIRFPCHLYGIRDAKEAYKAIEVERVKDYGPDLSLDDSFVLHRNYPDHHDEGGRCLLRCNTCGALMLTQHSMEDCPYWDEPDLYFSDRLPVASVEEAELLNILWDEEELKKYPFRYLRRDDFRYLWTEGNEPVPYDTEELKKKIRGKYAGLWSAQAQFYTGE